MTELSVREIEEQINLVNLKHALLIRLLSEKKKNAELKRCQYDTDRVTAVICRRFDMKEIALFSPARIPSVVIPRQRAMYLLCLMGHTTQNIAFCMRKKDHSTVIHARKQVQNEIDVDPKIRMEIAQMKQEIEQLQKVA